MLLMEWGGDHDERPQDVKDGLRDDRLSGVSVAFFLDCYSLDSLDCCCRSPVELAY